MESEHRFIVHPSLPSSVAENYWFIRHFPDKIRPSYQVYRALSHSITDSEIACVQIEGVTRLKDHKHLSHLLGTFGTREDKIGEACMA